MYEFTCGHLECNAVLRSTDPKHLETEMAQHLKEAHNVPKATQTIVQYLKETCVKPKLTSSGG